MENKNIKNYSSEELKKEIQRRKEIEAEQQIKKQKEREINRLNQLKKDIIKNPEKINEQLFYKEYVYTEAVASFYLNHLNKISDYINKNSLNEFRKFYNENRRETIENLLFDIGLINSDHLLTELSLKDALTKNKEGSKYLEPSSVFEVTKILVKNNEIELLSGSRNPITKNIAMYDSNELQLPFQMPKGGISYYAHSFRFNYTIDYAKHQKTKNELKDIRDRRIRDLFFNLGLENTRWIHHFLNTYNKHEIILRKNGIIGDDLLKKISDYDFMQENYEKELKELDESIYKTQFEQQGKILKFISQNPKPYLTLVKNLIDEVKGKKGDIKDYRPNSSVPEWGSITTIGDVGFSGSNGGPIGNLEKISKEEYLGRR